MAIKTSINSLIMMIDEHEAKSLTLQLGMAIRVLAERGKSVDKLVDLHIKIKEYLSNGN